MPDQAQILRGLMERRSDPDECDRSASVPRARTVAVTSGKGGVGKSSIALNLAIAIRQAEQTVCLFDANLGLGNIDLLCGLCGYWNLAHVVSGARTLSEIVLEGPAGIHVVPGASGLLELSDVSPAAQREVLSQLDELERRHNYLIFDTGTGIHRSVRQFVAAADVVLVVTTPEPTAIADAYATLKALSTGRDIGAPHILVNQADSTEQAREIIDRVQQTARTFLHMDVSSAGSIPRDPAVSQAVAAQKPFQIHSPRSSAARAVEQLARRMINGAASKAEAQHYFSRFGAFSDRKTA